MKKLILLCSVIFLGFTDLIGQQYYMTAPQGFGAGTTGGGSASPVTVTSYSALKTALTSSTTAAVILVSGTIDFSSSGMIKSVIKNKTLIGLPGAKFTNTNQSVSGILYLSSGSTNVIIRNLLFVGPGAWDNNGNDNLCADGCTKLWVDHCEFQDGEDGNFDIKGNTDNATVSWCKFTYLKAPRPAGSGTTNDHRFSGLVGSSGSDAPSDGHFSITFQNNYWAAGCMQRMPRARNAELHILNCYYNTSPTSTVALGIGGGSNNSTVYVENCDFASIGTVYKSYDGTDGGTEKLTFSGCLSAVADVGVVAKPSYTYTAFPVASVASAVPNTTCGAGATLLVTSAGVISANSSCSNTPPTVSLTAPANSSSSCQGIAITLTATASDAGGSISKVEFYDGTTLLGSATTSPYTYSWTNAAAGTHSITAKATDNGGLSTTSTAINITVNAAPAAPTFTTPSPYCQNATATALSATGTALLWYTVPTSGTGSATAPTPSTTTAGTTSYYVSQTTNGCESARATIPVTVNTAPSAPTVTTPAPYCQNATATALTASGTSLKWYTVPTNGTSSATAPVPSTATAGTTSYYVSQTTNGCESARATIPVTVNTAPSAPTVTTPAPYCQNVTATALTASGTSLKWYTVPTNGTSSATAPVPSTATVGTTSYYVSQTTNGCESARATIPVTVNTAPSAPTVTTPAPYCQNASATALTASGTSLKWYTVPTNGTSSATAPVPSTATVGTTSYYVSQTTSGCEGPRATIAVTVNATPSAPTVSTPVTYCQNATATALTATGISLNWYTVPSSGTSSATAPTPSTSTIGTTSYYVSQTTNGCESGRATIGVTVNSLPSASITAGGPTSFPQGGSVVLSANTGTGLTYKWFNGTSQVGTNSTYTATTGGDYTVEVTNASSCKATSSVVTVTVNGNVSPTVSITSPLNGATFTALANMTISANAADADGTVSKVDFYNGGTLLGTDPTSPYSFAFNNVAAGTYTLIAKATDNMGGVTTSASVTITVNANQSSVITIVSPTNNSTVTGSSVAINVNATDPDGTITKVEYLDGNTVIGTSTTQPYTYTWSNPTAGTHVITVRVTDSNGGVTTSTPTTVTVGTGTGIISSSYGAFTQVYPNPSLEAFTVKASQGIKNLSVINMYGVEVINLQDITADQQIEIGKELTDGTYVLLIKYTSDKMEVAKIVKIK